MPFIIQVMEKNEKNEPPSPPPQGIEPKSQQSDAPPLCYRRLFHKLQPVAKILRYFLKKKKKQLF